MAEYIISKIDEEKNKSWEAIKEIPQRYQNILNIFFNFDINNNCLKEENIIKEYPKEKINLIKELEEDEEEKTNNNISTSKRVFATKSISSYL